MMSTSAVFKDGHRHLPHHCALSKPTYGLCYMFCCCVVLRLTKLKQHAQHQAQHTAAFSALCNGKVTLLTMFSKTTSQKVMQGGSRASTVQTEALPEKQQAEKDGVKKNKNQTHLKVVVCVLLCISVCLFGAAFLSFCLLLFVPSPHFSGLQSYCCPNNPSSRKKKGKKGVQGRRTRRRWKKNKKKK